MRGINVLMKRPRFTYRILQFLERWFEKVAATFFAIFYEIFRTKVILKKSPPPLDLTKQTRKGTNLLVYFICSVGESASSGWPAAENQTSCHFLDHSVGGSNSRLSQVSREATPGCHNQLRRTPYLIFFCLFCMFPLCQGTAQQKDKINTETFLREWLG